MYKTIMAIGISLMIVGCTFGLAAALYSSRLSAIEDLLSSARTTPPTLPQMSLEIKNRIYFLQWGFIILLLSGFILLSKSLGMHYDGEKVTNKIIAVLLMFLLFPLFPMVKATPNLSDRWYASLYLMQPRNSEGIRGNIHFYANTLDPDYQNSFVAFRLMLVRIDVVYYEQEWLEVGYFQNQTGYWIYSASFLRSQGYTVNDAHQLDPPSANHSFVFEIRQKLEQPDTFEAKREIIQQDGMYPPVYEVLKTVTFTINSDNYYHAASESNDDLNSLTAYYSELKFYENGWQPWNSISDEADPPYRVQLGSTDKFHTYRIGSIGTGQRIHGGGGYLTMLIGNTNG